MAECLELFDESTGAVFGGVAAGEPVGAEFAEGDAVGDDVVVGDRGMSWRVAPIAFASPRRPRICQ